MPLPRRKTKEPTKCLVCGAAKAALYHGGMTCISCRSFFVRAARSAKDYTCVMGGNCTVTNDKESYCCKGCRYRKCLEAGMNIELVPSFQRKDGTYTKYTEGLLQREVTPSISLGYKFAAIATNPMSAIKMAQFYSNIDKLMTVRGAFTGLLRPFTLQISLADALLDSNYCFNKKEFMDLSPEQAFPLLVAHNYARTVAGILDFTTAIPEFLLLSLADKMRLLQKNYCMMVVMRAINELYWDPAPPVVPRLLAGQVCAVSKYTTERVQMLGNFMAQYVVPIFNEIQMTKEEGMLLLLVVCFTACVDCSDEGRVIIRQARNKYVNMLKSYQQEKFLNMTDQQKVKRFRLQLEFITHLQDLAVHGDACFMSQVLNNADSMLGPLSYDLHVRQYVD